MNLSPQQLSVLISSDVDLGPNADGDQVRAQGFELEGHSSSNNQSTPLDNVTPGSTAGEASNQTSADAHHPAQKPQTEGKPTPHVPSALIVVYHPLDGRPIAFTRNSLSRHTHDGKKIYNYSSKTEGSHYEYAISHILTTFGLVEPKNGREISYILPDLGTWKMQVSYLPAGEIPFFMDIDPIAWVTSLTTAFGLRLLP